MVDLLYVYYKITNDVMNSIVLHFYADITVLHVSSKLSRNDFHSDTSQVQLHLWAYSLKYPTKNKDYDVSLVTVQHRNMLLLTELEVHTRKYLF